MQVSCETGWRSIRVCLWGCGDRVFDKCCILVLQVIAHGVGNPQSKIYWRSHQRLVLCFQKQISGKWVKSWDQQVGRVMWPVSSLYCRCQAWVPPGHSLFEKGKVQWKSDPGSYISFLVAISVARAFLCFQCVFCTVSSVLSTIPSILFWIRQSFIPPWEQLIFWVRRSTDALWKLSSAALRTLFWIWLHIPGILNSQRMTWFVFSFHFFPLFCSLQHHFQLFFFFLDYELRKLS